MVCAAPAGKDAEKMEARKIRIGFLLLVGIVFLFFFSPPSWGGENKFLVVHLDAVSSVDFCAQLEKGRLPNIEALFAEGRLVKYGLSLFPGGTEMICPRLKKGLDNSEHHIVGWTRWDREQARRVLNIETFLEMVGGFPRRSRHQFLLGLPGLSHLAGLSLLNVERLWETEDVVEFFWFCTDAAGHLFGLNAHLKALHRLDYYLGLLHRSGKLKGANIVIYTDHGMSAGEVERVDFTALISEVLGDDLLYADYPNIYVKNPLKKREFAEMIKAEDQVDLVLWQEEENSLCGLTCRGSFQITKKDAEYRYAAEGEDFFFYESLGYRGEFLTRDEWLHLTKDHLYPAAVPNLFGFLSNPKAGDLVLVADFPKIPLSLTSRHAHHSGLRNTDLLVPLLVTGPAFAEMETFEEFWLHELFTEKLPMIDFNAPPQRERNVLSLAYPGQLELVLSPFYRWRGGLSLAPGKAEPWLEFDLYSSFLTRVWIGTFYAQEQLDWQLKVEGFLGDFCLSWLKRPQSPGRYGLGWRFHKQAELRLSPGEVGLSFLF